MHSGPGGCIVTARSVAPPTLAQLKKAAPPTLSLEEAAPYLGVSRSTAYESHRLGTFPVRTIRVSRRIRVITSSLIAVLEDDEAARPAQARAGSS